MNTERMLQLADLIEKLPHENADHAMGPAFTMTDFTYDCGTPACMAGWAAHLATGENDLCGLPCALKAAEWLDIDPDWADELFIPAVPLRDITPAMAAKMLRVLAALGKEPNYKEMTCLWIEVMGG